MSREMEQMSRWLQVLRLQKYIPVFEQHRMTVKRLSSISDAELGSMGLPVGPRKKLLAYLGVMRAASTQSSQGTQPDSQSAPPPSRYSKDDPNNKPCTRPSESSKPAGSPSTRHTSIQSPLSTQHPNIPRGFNTPTRTETQHAQQLASYPPGRSAHPTDSHGQKRQRQQFSLIQPNLVEHYTEYAGNKTKSTHETSNVAKTSRALQEAKSIHSTSSVDNKTSIPTLVVKHVHASSNAINKPVPTLVSSVNRASGYDASRPANRLQGSCELLSQQKQLTRERNTVDAFSTDDGSALEDGSSMKRVRAAGAEVGGWNDGLRSCQQRSSSCSHWGHTTRVDPAPPEAANDALRESVCWGLGSDSVSQPDRSQSAGRERGNTGCGQGELGFEQGVLGQTAGSGQDSTGRGRGNTGRECGDTGRERDNTSCVQRDLGFEQGDVNQSAGCGRGITACEQGRMEWEWGAVGREQGSTRAEPSTTGSQAGNPSNPLHRPPPSSVCKLSRETSPHASHDTSSGYESLSSPRGNEGCTAVRGEKHMGAEQGAQLMAVTIPPCTTPFVQPVVQLPVWRKKEQELLPVLYPERHEKTGACTSPGSTPELPACRIKRRRLIPADGLWSSAASSVQVPITRWAATQPSTRGNSAGPPITPTVSKEPLELSQPLLGIQEQLQASRTAAHDAISPASSPKQTSQLTMPEQLQPPCTMANSPVRAHQQPPQLRLQEQWQPPYMAVQHPESAHQQTSQLTIPDQSQPPCMAVQHPASALQQTPQLRFQEQLQSPPTTAQPASSPVTPASDLKSSRHDPHPPARTPAPAASHTVCPTPPPSAHVPGGHRRDAAAARSASHHTVCPTPTPLAQWTGNRRHSAAATGFASHTACCTPPQSSQVLSGHRCDATAAGSASHIVCPTPLPSSQVLSGHRCDATAAGSASHIVCPMLLPSAQVPSGHRCDAAAADTVCPMPSPSAQVPCGPDGHSCDAAACMAEYGLSGIGCKQACIPTGEEPDPGAENLRLVALRKELQAAEKLVARLKILIWECKLDMSDPEELESGGNMHT